MSYARPKLTTLIAQVQQDIAASPIAINGYLPSSVLYVLAVVMAGLAYLHYDFQDYIAKQAVPWSATDEWADGWGAVRGVTRKPATNAVLTVTNSDGVAATQIPNQTSFIRQDGAKFTSTAATAFGSDGTATVTLQADDSGSGGNTANGAVFTLSSAITGAPLSGWMVASTVTTAVDVETDDALKARYLQEWSAPAQGGSLLDWLDWALAVPGVTRAWIAPGGWGPGTVTVFFMMDNAQAAHDGFPQGTNGTAAAETRDPFHIAAGDQLTVANAIYPQRPVTALVYGCAPVQTPVPFTVAGLGAANTADNQAAITAALKDMFLHAGNVGGTIDPDTNEAYAPIATGTWYGAIASALGNDAFSVSSPSAPLTPGPGQLFTLGAVTFED